MLSVQSNFILLGMPRQAWAFIWGVGESEGVLESSVFFAGERRCRLAGSASAGPTLQGGMT